MLTTRLGSVCGSHEAVQTMSLQVDKSYGVEEECILKASGAENDLGGTFIVRLPAGPEDQYLRQALSLLCLNNCNSTDSLVQLHA